jgi:hypothetical protein
MCKTYPGFTFPARLASYRDNVYARRHSGEEHALGVAVIQGSSASCCFLIAATGSGWTRSSLLAEDRSMCRINALERGEGAQA